jgi:hypothetical protein
MDTEYTCTHCGGDYVAPVDSGATLCGACAEFSEFAELGHRVLNSNGGRGDTAAASIAMGYPTFGDDSHITYHVREFGGSIPVLSLCGAHDALYRWDAVSADGGISHDDAPAHYCTPGAPLSCDTCNEWAGGYGWAQVERRPVSDAHCDTCTC